MKFSRLFELYEGTPVYREAVDKVIFEDLDLEGTRKVMQRLQDGSVRLEVTAVSPMGQQGIGHAKELIQPQRADHAILMALKKRLEDEVLFMSCLNCRSQVRRRSGDAPEREVCEVCGGEMVAALKGYERETLRLLGKIELSEADRRDLARLWRNANIVHSYGRKAVLALSGRGVGPDAASRILQMYHQEEDDLLRDILAAEVNYARTKRFWD
jgi:ATP-dependent Lhr-like helicase